MKANLQAVGMQARLNGSSDSILAASEEERPNDFSGSEVAATGHVRPNDSHECGWQPMVTLNRIKRVVAGWLLVDMEGRMTDLSAGWQPSDLLRGSNG